MALHAELQLIVRAKSTRRITIAAVMIHRIDFATPGFTFQEA
jgi:hypothetical protein